MLGAASLRQQALTQNPGETTHPDDIV